MNVYCEKVSHRRFVRILYTTYPTNLNYWDEVFDSLGSKNKFQIII